MNIDAAVPPKRSGLAILWDTIVAPNAAFESIRLKPRWLVALIVTLVVGTIGTVLIVPANVHIASVIFPKMIAANPSLAGLSPEKQQQALANLELIQRFAPLIVPFATTFSLLMTAVVMFVAALVSRSKISFGLAFSLACNVGFVYSGLFTLLVGIMAQLRGADSYSSQAELFSALPSLAWAFPSAGPKGFAFLAMVNVFTIWSFLLTAYGMRKAAGVGTIASYLVATLFFLTIASLLAAGAQ